MRITKPLSEENPRFTQMLEMECCWIPRWACADKNLAASQLCLGLVVSRFIVL